MVRDIQEMVNRNRSGGVSVYSPVRRLVRPTGRTANAGTAAGVLGGGQPYAQPTTVTQSFGGIGQPLQSSPSSQLPGWAAAIGSQPTGGGTTLDRLIGQSQAAVTQQKPGGFWGSAPGQAIGTVVNNPVGRAAFEVLDALNVPRRVIQSSVQEAADAVNGGDASFADWTQQIGDEDFGFGHMVPETGNTWLDRFIGLGGDILLDPMTYVGGSGLWANASGRAARAGAAADVIAAGARVGELTAEATAGKVGRWGWSRFDDAARAELRAQLPGSAQRMLDRGYHFKVPLTDRFYKIPFTEPVDWAVSRATGRVRDTLSRSPLGGWMRYATNPNGMRDAVTTLVTGRNARGMTMAKAAEVVNFNAGRKLSSKTFVAKVNQMAQQYLSAHGGRTQGNNALSEMFRTSEAAGGTAAHEFYAAVRKMATEEFGIRVPELENYLPHFWTDGGRRWLDGGSQAAQDIKTQWFKEIDLDDTSPVLLHRKFLAGQTYTIAGHEFKLVDGSADEINRIFRRLEPDAGFDLIDTDFSSTAARYAKSLEESVGLVGGLKKALGSKSGLIRSLHDESMASLITEEDLAALANRDTAAALKNQWRAASSLVKEIREDTRKGLRGIGGQLGVEMREALDELTTIGTKKKEALDALLGRQIDLENQRGVGKYDEALAVHDGAADWVTGTHPSMEPTALERQLDATYNELGRRHAELERQLGELRPAAIAEAKELEAQFGKARYYRSLAQVPGKISAQREFQRLAAESAAVAMDASTIETLMIRLEVNREAQGLIDRRMNDQDFMNLAVADAESSPKYPGFADPDDDAEYFYTPATYNDDTGEFSQPQLLRRKPEPTAVYIGSSPLQVRQDWAEKRRALLGTNNPRVTDLHDQYVAQAKIVEHARERLSLARANNREAVEVARSELANGRQFEAGLKYAVDRTRGKPDWLEQHHEWGERLDVFRENDLARLNNDYIAARKPYLDAKKVHDSELRKLQEILDNQMLIARELDAENVRAPRTPPLNGGQVADLRTRRAKLMGDRVGWHKSRTGRLYATAQRNLKALRTRYDDVSRRIEGMTSRGGRFFFDSEGALQPKFTTGETWAKRLIENRDDVLIPARNRAEEHYEATREIWERIERHTTDVNSADLRAAQREVKRGWEEWKAAQARVVEANRRLARTPPKDVPDLGRIAVEEDQLRRMIEEQARLKARVDEVTHRVDELSPPLNRIEDELGGIESQLEAQRSAQRAIDAQTAVNNTHEARLSDLNRQEQQRLELVEDNFKGYKQDWEEMPELPPQSIDLGRFEGRYEKDPVIRNALEAIHRLDVAARTGQLDMDVVSSIEDSMRALQAAQKPFDVPAKDTPEWASVMEFSPQGRGGAMGAVGRGQAVAAQAQRVIGEHMDELVEIGALSPTYAHEMIRRRLDLDRALDLYALSPGPHIRHDVEQQASELNRITNFALRYKAAIEGGNEPSEALAAFLLSRELKQESDNLKYQLGKGRERLASYKGGKEELAYTRTLAVLNQEVAQRQFNIESELAKRDAGEAWDRPQVKQWTKQINGLNEQIALLRPPTYGALDDTIDGMVDYLLEGMISIDNATMSYNDARHITYHMQWPVRREAQLTAEIPRFEGELAAMRTGQKRLQLAVNRARAKGSDVVRYRPYSTDAFTLSYDEAKALIAAGEVPEHLVPTLQRQINMSDAAFKKNPNRPRRQINWREEIETGVMEMPMMQAEENLRLNAQMIDSLNHDIANKQIQLEVINGTAQSQLNRLDAELADFDTPPDPNVLRQQNNEIRNRAHAGRRRYTSEEFDIRRSNRERLQRLEQGKPHYTVIRKMREDAERYRKAIAEFEELLGGDTTYMTIGHDQGVQFMRDLVTGKRMPNQRDWMIMRELIGESNAANAELWIRFMDELIAGRRTATHEEVVDFFDQAMRVLGDNEMLDRMKERAIGTMGDEGLPDSYDLESAVRLHEDESVGAGDEGAGRVLRSENRTFDEMREELASAMIASANRQRQESIAEFNSMLKMFGMTFPDGYTGYRQRLKYLGIDEPNHRLLVAKLRRFTVESMERMGYDPRNAIVDLVTDMRSKLGRVNTMRRGVGAQVNRLNLKNPEEFFLWYHSLENATGAQQIADEARQFTAMAVPAEVEAVYAARLTQLDREVEAAVTAGDTMLVRSLTAQRRAVERGRGQALANAEAGAVSAAPSPVLDGPSPTVDRAAITAQRDEAQAAVARYDEQIAALRASVPPSPAVQSSTEELTTQMHALVRRAIEAGKPEGYFSQAEMNIVSQQAMLVAAKGDVAESNRLIEIGQAMIPRKWSDEPAELRQAANDLKEAWKDARAVERGGPQPGTADPSLMLQIEGLTKERALAQSNLAEAERQLSAADAMPSTQVDNAGMHAQREQLNLQRNQAIMAGDIQGVEDLTRQINELDQQLHGSAVDDAQSASASPFEDPLAGQLNEGQAMPKPEQETIPETAFDATIPPSGMGDDEIGRELALTQQQLSDVLQRHGGFANASSTDQQLAGILASRIRKLTEIQNGRIDEARRAFLGTKLPEYHRYMRSVAASAAEGENTIDYDWMNILFNGTPTVALSRQGLQGPMGRITQGATSVRARPGGAASRGAISPQLETLRTRLLPRKALRAELDAAKERLVEEERMILGEIDPVAERAATEPGRQARMEEIRRRHGEGPDMSDMTDPAAFRAEAESRQDDMMNEMSRLQRDADIAERMHTERMKEIDMELANVRQRVMWASRDYASFDQFRTQLVNSISKNPANPKGMNALIEDMKVVNAARKELVGAEDLAAADEELRGIAHIEAMLAAASESTARLEAAQLSKDTLKRRMDDLAKDSERAAEVTKNLLADGWRIIAKDIIDDSPEGMLVATGLAEAIELVQETARRPEFWKWIDKYTAFFKTYATAKPGFHVRNSLSATFMNLVDGVRLRDMYQGVRLWRQFERDPEFWMRAGVDPRVRDAFSAVFASGAGGQFQEFGVGTVAGQANIFYRKLMNNRLTRWNRRVGSRVEGSARLAMALNSTLHRGYTAEQTMRRVAKFHFDYDELSELDRHARRYIPFWTFMSRNLPLQLEQMIINPRTYLQYQSLVRNFGEQLDPLTPEYWLSQGVFTVDENAPDREAPWYLAPDLPHLRVTEPLDALMRGDWGKAGFSDINPLFLSPLEAGVTQEKTYTGAPLTGYHEAVGPMKLFTPLFNLLGGTETGGTSGNTLIDDRYSHVVRSTLPPIDFLERLMDPTGARAGRQDETLYRAAGAPVYQLTPELRESTKRSRYYDRRDQFETQAELARS